MSKQDKPLRTGLALFSLITSFLFVYYAISIITSGNAHDSLKIFAYVAGGYGLMNTYILSFAWRNQISWAPSANMVISICFFGVVVMDILREGLKGGIQIGGLAGLVVVLLINWFTIRKLCR